MNIRQAKKLGTYGLIIVFGIVVTVEIFEFPQFSAQLNLLALVATLVVLIWYAHDTHRIANESVSQTELQTMPIMCLYVRNVDGIEIEEKREKIKQYAVTHQVENAIIPSPVYIALRSMGNGSAFNVSVESNNFKAEKYQTRFFAPKKDEHAVKIIKKSNGKIRDLSEVNGEIFTIKCKSVLGKEYEYKYRIIDVTGRTVEFLK